MSAVQTEEEMLAVFVPLIGSRGVTFTGEPLTPGVNVDKVDIDAGLRLATAFGYDDPESRMVLVYALQRWRRGEEDGAQRTALSGGIDLTSWYAVIAAATSAAVTPQDSRFEPAVMGHRPVTTTHP